VANAPPANRDLDRLTVHRTLSPLASLSAGRWAAGADDPRFMARLLRDGGMASLYNRKLRRL
jgi:hypothetical protein